MAQCIQHSPIPVPKSILRIGLLSYTVTLTGMHALVIYLAVDMLQQRSMQRLEPSSALLINHEECQ